MTKPSGWQWKKFFENQAAYISTGQHRTADFAIDLHPAPIILEVGSGKTDLSQLTSHKEKRYGILIKAKATKPVVNKGVLIILPMSWFLLL